MRTLNLKTGQPFVVEDSTSLGICVFLTIYPQMHPSLWTIDQALRVPGLDSRPF